MQHEKVEKNLGLMTILIVIAVSFGGLVEIVPLFFIKDTTEPTASLEPYSATELAGRDIYIREGCNVCHTQMIRPLRAEVERYGHYSVAGEYYYDYPHLWGSKRTGPDLHRVGGRYSDEWHIQHLLDPRSVVPESNMPAFPWLFDQTVDGDVVVKKMTALDKWTNVSYTEAELAGAAAEVDGVREIDALVAYLQRLGSGLERQ